MTAFLACVLKKKYTNPSSDVITVLAGLDEVDRVFSDFVAMLDGIIRNGNSSEWLLEEYSIFGVSNVMFQLMSVSRLSELLLRW